LAKDRKLGETSMTRLRKATTFAACAVLLIQCSPKPVPPEPAKAVTYSYDIAVALTPAASAYLTSHGDDLVVTALYYGNPTSQTASLADVKDGTIHLNTDKVELEGKPQTFHMTGAGVDPARVKFITEQKPLVLLNIFSGHAGLANKALKCTDFQDYVSVAQTSLVTLKCDMNGSGN